MGGANERKGKGGNLLIQFNATKNITDDDDYDDAANNNFGEASGDQNSVALAGKEVRYAPQHSNPICNQAPLQRAHSR